MIALDVVTEAGEWSRAGVTEAGAVEAAEASWRVASEAPDEAVTATLLLTDDATMRALNRQWRRKDAATNVLSFPAAHPRIPGRPRHLGDVALGFETVVREAEAGGRGVPDHMAHLVVHGVLHLLGRDHEVDAEADAMERVEIAALALMGIADPYGDRPA